MMAPATAVTKASARPKITLLSLLDEPDDFGMYEPLLADMAEQADIVKVVDAAAAVALFASEPHVVLATDKALSESDALRIEAVSFVRRGGTLILCCRFASSKFVGMNSVFAAFDLPWRFGAYCRDTWALNPAMTHIDTSKLPARYSQKANQLWGVQDSDALYLLDPSSRELEPEDTMITTPAALGNCGSGKLGYLGDVNQEDETDLVLMAMCSLRVPPLQARRRDVCLTISSMGQDITFGPPPPTRPSGSVD